MQRQWLLAALMSAATIATPAAAQTAMTLMGSDAVTWTVNPAMPKGFRAATLIGDPKKAGDMVVQRVWLPAHAQVPPHTHPFAETVTVISGRVGFGHGDKLERSGPMLAAGGFFAHPAGDPHYVWTEDEEAVVQIQFIGPGGIDYVNPADDPRKQ